MCLNKKYSSFKYAVNFIQVKFKNFFKKIQNGTEGLNIIWIQIPCYNI